MNIVVSSFRERKVLSIFKPEQVATLLKKVEILVIRLHVEDRTGRNATIIKK